MIYWSKFQTTNIYLTLEISKSIIGKYSKNLFDITKKYATDALKLHKKTNKKKAEATVGSIGSEISHKNTNKTNS